MDLAAAGLDVGLRGLGSSLGFGGARLGDLRAQLLGERILRLDRRERPLLPAPPEQRSDPEAAGYHSEEAFHKPDATLAALLATPVAPSPEAAP